MLLRMSHGNSSGIKSGFRCLMTAYGFETRQNTSSACILSDTDILSAPAWGPSLQSVMLQNCRNDKEKKWSRISLVLLKNKMCQTVPQSCVGAGLHAYLCQLSQHGASFSSRVNDELWDVCFS